MKKFIYCTLFALTAQAATAAIIFQTDFDDAASVNLFSMVNTVGGIWENDIANLHTNGSGQLVNNLTYGFGTTVAGLSTTITTNTGVYEIAYNGVTFSNLAGGNDYMVFAYRTAPSGTVLPGSSSTRGWLKFGDFDGTAGLDLAYGKNNADLSNVVNNVGSLALSYNFIAQWDTGKSELSFYYDSGSGRVQIGSTLTGAATNDVPKLGMYASVTDSGAGDAILVDQIQVMSVPVPEPSTYAMLSGVLVLCLAWIRRRR